MLAKLRGACRFTKSESGAATVEFVLVFPFFLGLFLSAYEVAVMNTRAVMVERAMDIAVREIRLGTGGTVNYPGVIEEVCKLAYLIHDCEDAMKIEMTAVNMQNWTGFPNDTECVDRRLPAQPVTDFSNGLQNELMLIRMCVVVDPVFMNFGVGRSMPKDDTGGYQIMSMSAFVNEPL